MTGSPQATAPSEAGEAGYAPPRPADQDVAPGSVFDPHPLVLSLEHIDGPRRHLDLADAPAVIRRWREALISHADDLDDGARALCSGHRPDGAPLERPHLAALPLAFVGHPHADGRLLGLALAWPRELPAAERRAALGAIAGVRELKLGRLGRWRLASAGTAPTLQSLRTPAWTAHPDGATHWASVTPVSFDRHPKAKDRAAYQHACADMIRRACRHTGLPDPREVIVTAISPHPGAPPAHAFPRLQRKDGGERRQAHVILVFDEPVCGPVLLGAGRYRGYGVCRPLPAEPD